MAQLFDRRAAPHLRQPRSDTCQSMARFDLAYPPAALGRADAAAYLGLSESTFGRLVQKREIPLPRQLAEKRVAWLRCELDAWLLARPVSNQLPPPNTGAPRPGPKR